MAAPTEVYVDYVNTPGGDGSTFALARDTVQSAVDNETAGGSGHRFNIYATGTTLAAVGVELSTYGTPTESSPVYFQGVSAAGVPGDGGKATFDGDGTYAFFDAASLDFVHFRDLVITNTGAAVPITCDDSCSVVNCTISDTTGDGIVLGFAVFAMYNTITNIGGFGISAGLGQIMFNRIVDGANTMTKGINTTSNGATVGFNSIWLNSTGAIGIGLGHESLCCFNSIYNNTAGTSSGIQRLVDSQSFGPIVGNIIEGFDGTGGEAMWLPATGMSDAIMNNKFFAVTSEFTNSAQLVNSSGNVTLAASPFRDAAAGDLRVVDAAGLPLTAGVKELGNLGIGTF